MSFEEYINEIKITIKDYRYTNDDVLKYESYFKDCWINNLSTYKAVEWLSFEIDVE